MGRSNRLTNNKIVPVPRTWKNGDVPTYDVVQADLFDTLTWLANRPFVKLRQTTTQSLSSGTPAVLTWDYVDNDPFQMFNKTASTTKITPTVPGWYFGSVCSGPQALGTGADSTGYRELQVRLNGSDVRWCRRATPMQASNGTTRIPLTFFLPFNGTTDYVEARYFQNSGSTMSTKFDANSKQNAFFMIWFARY